MSKQSRRNFLVNSGKAATVAGLLGISSTSFSQAAPKGVFLHHVYFWLKNPSSLEDRAKLIEGLKNLSKVKTIDFFHIGQPADTSRDVIDRSYAISWLLFFKNKADQDSYQEDPIHLGFVDKYSHLWSKVVVYDSVDI